MLLGLLGLFQATQALPAPLPTSRRGPGRSTRRSHHSALEANQCGSRKGNPEETRVRGPTRKITDAAPMAPMALRLGVFARMAWECWPTTQPAFFFFLLARAGIGHGIFVVLPKRGRSKQFHCSSNQQQNMGRTVAFRTYLESHTFVMYSQTRGEVSLHGSTRFVKSHR